ncbi:helicase HerA-like domain-containing protein [Saccharothrix deserti]|uniref:helicase HerA-like domain-containing protein n=1 Tax=Saccharothrix deserti TaxID=2593674 RepID=UPI00192E4F25|nr:helicase HerA-like domain-containing protein [Saccharothrix deserti]
MTAQSDIAAGCATEGAAIGFGAALEGAPTTVAWTRLRAPRSLMDTIGSDAIKQAAASSELHGKYAETGWPRVGLREADRQGGAPAGPARGGATTEAGTRRAGRGGAGARQRGGEVAPPISLGCSRA